MGANLLQPLWLDIGQAAPKQACGFYQFGRHQPAPRLFGQMRPGMGKELDAARTQVLALRAFAFGFEANIAQQAGQHSQVQLLVAGWAGIELPLVFGHHGVQLAVNIAPLAHPAQADKVLAQQLLVLAVAEFVLVGGGAWVLAAAAVVQPLPQFEVATELAFLIVKLGMRLVGLGLQLHGPVPHILHAQGRGYHQHLVECLARTRLQNHPANPWVQRKPGQFLPGGGEFVGIVHRAKLCQQLVAIGNGAARGALQKRKVFHHAQTQGFHAQNHPGERAAQNLRVGKAWPAVKVFLVVQADTDAIGHPATAAGALVGRGLADGLHEQLLHLAAKTVALHARRASINHIPDAGHSERGFGHIGGQHNPPAAVAVKNAVLLSLAQARKQRQNLGVTHQRLVAQVSAQVVSGLANFPLTGQKHQDIALVVGVAPELVHAIGDGVVQVVVTRLFKRPVALLHREHAARHHDDRRRAGPGFEVVGKALCIDGGRGDHHLQIGSARQDLTQIAQ